MWIEYVSEVVSEVEIFDHKALEFELMSSVSEKYTKLFKLNLSILISRIIFRPLLLQNQELSNVILFSIK